MNSKAVSIQLLLYRSVTAYGTYGTVLAISIPAKLINYGVREQIPAKNK